MCKFLSLNDIIAAQNIAKISIFLYQKRAYELQMKIEEFAELLGVTSEKIIEWESANYNFSIEDLATIASKLNLKLNIEFTSNT